jgi:hypothetical protein
VLLVALLAGCAKEPAETDDIGKQIDLTSGQHTPPPPPPPPPPPQDLPYPRGGRMELGNDPIKPSENKDVLRVKAEVGVGKRGRRLDNKNLVKSIVTPARALFRTRERVIFEIQIPKALSLYEATNGSKPKTHEEFMEEVIAPNKIELPELPAGQKYVYDPETGELMVEKPAR